ncbi:hypothetical protein GCM10020331_073410 [Ectobacillus funiculus]
MPKKPKKSFSDENIEAQRFESFRQQNIWSYDARNRDVKRAIPN